MNRSLKESLVGRRIVPVGSQQRWGGQSVNGISNDADDHLDLFSKHRRKHSVASVASSDESEVSVKLGRLSVGSAKVAHNGMDDLLSIDGGKHDYDWLLTPPGTPNYLLTSKTEAQPASAAPRTSSLARSVSTSKASRLSVSQSESNHNPPSRPTRSNSVTRPAISSTQYSTYSNKSSSILNTSSSSVSSYIRPSTPTSRSSSRPSTPSIRPISRSSTPSRARPAPTISTIDKTKPTQNSRPSTPNSRPQIPANLISSAVRSASRPSTPTRRSQPPSLSPVAGHSTSVGRISSNVRTTAVSTSRPSSPSPRARAPPQPMVIPDFPLDTPPNLRTSLADRPVSAGRSRPRATSTGKGNTETPVRQPSPIVSRGRLTESTGRGRVNGNGQIGDSLQVSELSNRKPVKSSTTPTESMGFGRNISKKSLDMAIRHMDIRNGTNGTRPLAGTTLFPQSIRPTYPKAPPGRALSYPSSVNENRPVSRDGTNRGNGNYINNNNCIENGSEDDNCRIAAKIGGATDIYESSRYDAILFKEDLKNTSWLHSIDDKSDQESLFEHGLESLPEPFDPL